MLSLYTLYTSLLTSSLCILMLSYCRSDSRPRILRSTSTGNPIAPSAYDFFPTASPQTPLTTTASAEGRRAPLPSPRRSHAQRRSSHPAANFIEQVLSHVSQQEHELEQEQQAPPRSLRPDSSRSSTHQVAVPPRSSLRRRQSSPGLMPKLESMSESDDSSTRGANALAILASQVPQQSRVLRPRAGASPNSSPHHPSTNPTSHQAVASSAASRAGEDRAPPSSSSAKPTSVTGDATSTNVHVTNHHEMNDQGGVAEPTIQSPMPPPAYFPAPPAPITAPPPPPPPADADRRPQAPQLCGVTPPLSTEIKNPTVSHSKTTDPHTVPSNTIASAPNPIPSAAPTHRPISSRTTPTKNAADTRTRGHAAAGEEGTRTTSSSRRVHARHRSSPSTSTPKSTSGSATSKQASAPRRPSRSSVGKNFVKKTRRRTSMSANAVSAK